MRFTSPAFLSVFLITFVLAIPAPDKYIHHNEPGCPVVGAKACLLTDYCQYHRDRGDLFTTRNGELKSRDAPETENSDLNLKDALSLSSFTMRELAVKWKRTNIAKSAQCGTLSCVANREMSEQFSSLIAGRLYDFIVDYPYNGATGGMIGLFAKVYIQGAYHTTRVGFAHTGFGGFRFSYLARADAVWYEVIFFGDNPATAAINYFIAEHI